jgi:ParB family chromosome partitioning protein
MALRAQELLAGTGWLPEPLRTSRRSTPSSSPASEQDAIPVTEPAGVEMAANGHETAMVDSEPLVEDEVAAVDPAPVAAE